MEAIFKNIPVIKYEGKDSDNPLAFKHYNPEEKIDGKSMKEHLRFALAYWHTLTGQGSDMFGAGTMERPWDKANSPMEIAKIRLNAAFELMEKLSIDYFCFHDRDVAPEGNNLAESNKNLDEIISLMKKLMKEKNKKLLWGTANLFNHPRYVHGAGTSCNADIFAYAGSQLKKAIEVTKELGGENYVFWGGREGYETLLNTDLKFELENFARLLKMAVDYKKKIGFDGQFLIEPKPKEPTKHQYDFDSAHVLNFLRTYDLYDYFKLNIEANHATLAGHTFQHELYFARINGKLGSIDANQGDLLLGWDTDQYPTNLYDTTMCMYEVLKNGGIAPGGLNFDAKIRRGSLDTKDIFYGFIAGMDSFAVGLKAAHSLLKSKELEDFVENRYSSYKTGIGKDIVDGIVGFEDLEKYTMKNNTIENKSGRQELLEVIINKHIFDAVK